MINLLLIVVLAFSLVIPFIGFFTPKNRIHLTSSILSIIGFTLTLIIILDAYLLQRIPLDLQKYLLLLNPYLGNLTVNASGTLISFTGIFLALLTSIYSLKYMERDKGIPLYYSLLFLNVAGIVGVVSSHDFFTLFVFWELMCISSYVLVVFRKNELDSIEAGTKYMIMSSAGSITILFALTFIYAVTGTLSFQEVASVLKNTHLNPLIYLAMILLLIGFGIKTAIFPLHTWLPDVYMAAPSSVSAFMSGIVTVTGLYAIIQAFSVLSYAVDIHSIWVISILSVVNMFFGNITALLQDDLRRMLAYSSIAHIGYMLIGLSIWTVSSLTASIIHLFNHAFMKSVAFFCAGAITYQLGSGNLSEMYGLGRKMPLAASALIISLLALIGMPPLNGFISKLYLFLASVESGMFMLGLLLVINSAISAAYYLRIIRILLAPTSKNVENIREAPVQLLIPIYIASAFIIIFGIWPDPIINIAQSTALQILSIRGW